MSAAEISARMEIRRLEAKVADLEAKLGVSTRRNDDLDETRRLIYGALAASTGRAKRWELIGTLTNALVHHSRLESDPYDVIERLLDVVESYPGPDGEVRWDQGKVWLKMLAETITARLAGTEAE